MDSLVISRTTPQLVTIVINQLTGPLREIVQVINKGRDAEYGAQVLWKQSVPSLVSKGQASPVHQPLGGRTLCFKKGCKPEGMQELNTGAQLEHGRAGAYREVIECRIHLAGRESGSSTPLMYPL